VRLLREHFELPRTLDVLLLSGEMGMQDALISMANHIKAGDVQIKQIENIGKCSRTYITYSLL